MLPPVAYEPRRSYSSPPVLEQLEGPWAFVQILAATEQL